MIECNKLLELTTFVKTAPGTSGYRSTPIAVTNITNQKNLSLQFIKYLKSAEAHQVFVKWGWE